MKIRVPGSLHDFHARGCGSGQPSAMLSRMRLIAAALQQELGIALQLCRRVVRLPVAGATAWEGCRGAERFHFLKTGVGPVRTDRQFRAFLDLHTPSEVLIVGYGGALDPALRLGDLVVGRSALLLGEGGSPLPLGRLPLEGRWALAGSESLVAVAGSSGLTAVVGDILTSRHIIGAPAQKQLLRTAHGAAVVDMETAALARAAALRGIPVSCVRAVSDEAADELLAPLAYAPGQGAAARVAAVLAAGQWVDRYRGWRDHSARARVSLRVFLTAYLAEHEPGQPITPSPRSG